MAYIKVGTIAADPVGVRDPRKIFVKGGAAGTRLVLASTQNPVELDIAVPANSSFFMVASAGMHDRFPSGDALNATITGDSTSFVRIE